jgi:hypothetical protein
MYAVTHAPEDLKMSLSRRHFVTEASALGLLGAFLPELLSAQAAMPPAAEDTPHDSMDFWGGFFDSVNPNSPTYGIKGQQRGAKDQLPDPAVMTQYLHYGDQDRKLRYATDISSSELLDHDGDVAVSIQLSQYRQGDGEGVQRATQMRVDTTQTRPYMNIIAPLAWTALASLMPDRAGKIPSMDQLGFHSDQATQSTNKILLNQGMGKLAVNISQAAATSSFVKALGVMISAAKMAAPLVTLPAISVPALSSLTELLSYWEDRTRFVMAGNLTSVIATRQAMSDPEHPDRYIGLVSGDYLMVPQKHTDALHAQLDDLDVVQGYLVAKNADPSLPLQSRAQNILPGITYATMRVSVTLLESGVSKPTSPMAACPVPAAGKPMGKRS